uniref:Uncharacterized protein n=1 Tax=Knipowitschia caucasica TaxID=637954 RepID=A0AAV2LSC2_KNICA
MTEEAQVRDGPESWSEEAQVKTQSSLDLISIISSDTEPLVRSLWNKAETTDLSDPQSLKHLAEEAKDAATHNATEGGKEKVCWFCF